MTRPCPSIPVASISLTVRLMLGKFHFIVFFVFSALNVGGVVAQEESKSTVTSASPKRRVTPAGQMSGEVNLSLQ